MESCRAVKGFNRAEDEVFRAAEGSIRRVKAFNRGQNRSFRGQNPSFRGETEGKHEPDGGRATTPSRVQVRGFRIQRVVIYAHSVDILFPAVTIPRVDSAEIDRRRQPRNRGIAESRDEEDAMPKRSARAPPCRRSGKTACEKGPRREPPGTRAPFRTSLLRRAPGSNAGVPVHVHERQLRSLTQK
jgi:hypothetical protein